jgi:galactokinase
VAETLSAFAPGRVNLIGEHTDYNDGLSLPFAIADGVTVRATAGDDDRFEVLAADLDAHDQFALPDPNPVRGWRAFARGAAAELGRSGFELRGAQLQISGTVPRGSGLSSSAALEVALCLAMLAISGIEAGDLLELARICSRVENDWVGAQTGLLDQIASLCGERGSALRVDFRSLEVTPVPLRLAGWVLVTVDSGERHANAGPGEPGDGARDAPGYNQRRAECARACELLGIESLREATLEAASALPAPLNARARHVITENERVERTVAALQSGDLRRVGELLNQSHASLRDDFEISTPAVEATVRRLLDAGAVGARIVGGGFGGHVLGLLPPATAAPSDAIVVEPGPGAHLV